MRYLLLAATIITFYCCTKPQTYTKEQLGKLIFFDNSLSEPAGVACATCHRPERGFADTLSRPFSEGAVEGLFSKRTTMTISYAKYIPPLTYDSNEEVWMGGLFWDGRADSLSHQASQPFVNMMEMRNQNEEMVVEKIKKAKYYPTLRKLYGESNDPAIIFQHVTDALAEYQKSDEVNSFSSKFDLYLEGKNTLTEQEMLGYSLFKDKGKCSECHIIDQDKSAGKILFTDHTYDNLGIPKNPHNTFYHALTEHNPDSTNWIDLGLGETLNNPAENGKFRVPTLRNIELTAPYGHNSYFETLEDIVHFYNVRDVSNEYPPAEYPQNVNSDELGDLELTLQEEQAIVAFMKTLTDKR